MTSHTKNNLITNDEIIDALRVTAKFHITKNEIFRLKKLLMLPEMFLDKILTQNHLQLLFLKHIEENCLSDEWDKSIHLKYSNRLFRLQYEYKEYQDELKKILACFNELGIKYAILKGIIIGNSLFCKNNILYRTFSDVDILIKEDDINIVHNALTNCGYVQGKLINAKIQSATKREILFWRLNSHQLHEYIKRSIYSDISSMYMLNVDINITIFEGGIRTPPISTSELLNHVCENNINGLKMQCLEPTYNLLQLCYHFYKDIHYEIKRLNHQNFTLKKFCDIREFICKYREIINWTELFEISKEQKISSILYDVLSMISIFYGDLKIENHLAMFDDRKTKHKVQYDWAKMFI